MTLSTAWIRSVGDCEELVVATDSRLRFGMAWDCCPKILPLPRGDSFICFAGSTHYAYPLMLQMRSAIALHPKSRDRAMDLEALKGHTLRVFNNMSEYIHDLPKGSADEEPDAQFLFGGYSWHRRRFKLWVLYYDRHIRKFTFNLVASWRGIDGDRTAVFIGDEVTEAKRRLREILKDRGKLRKGGLDMEPFEVLRDMIRDEVSPHIGGPPQLIKVYLHLNTLPVGVYWPTRDSGELTVWGRPLLPYEAPECPVMDPDTLDVRWGGTTDESRAAF